MGSFLRVLGFLSLFMGFCLTAAWSAPPGGGGTSVEGVFGRDDRAPLPSVAYPFSAMGRVSHPGMTCSGVLVGERVVVTASHCVVHWVLRRGIIPVDAPYLSFRTALIDGKPQAVAQVESVIPGTLNFSYDGRKLSYRAPSDVLDDWALLVLKEPLGKTAGYLALTDSSSEGFYPQSVDAVGFSFDFQRGQTGSLQKGCAIQNRTVSGLLLHDCDNNHGASGGPLFIPSTEPGRPALLRAINVAQQVESSSGYSDDRANLALPSSRFAAKLREIQAP